ncbi:MAG: flavin reductase family protein [Syntrophorhabdaceae bacterium]|nr:flavin reductase family protein [Syntrophorhabdaceae bacterium]
MKKTEIGSETILYPMPCSIVGALVNKKPNYLAVAWLTMVNLKPPCIGISLGKMHYSNAGIKENGAFSINIPSVSMVDVTDYCGIVSGKKHDKAKQFETFYGKSGIAPMIGECPYNIECRLIQVVDLPTNEFFVGEIISVYSEERYLTNGEPDMKKIDPLVLSMPERSYLTLGEHIAEAWDTGKKMIKRQ